MLCVTRAELEAMRKGDVSIYLSILIYKYLFIYVYTYIYSWMLGVTRAEMEARVPLCT